MLKEINWSEERAYRVGSQSEPVHFYSDCLNNSNHFDLLLGYFNSAAISNLSLYFARFLKQGGTMRLIVTDVQQSMDSLDKRSRHFLNCVAWMIENKKVQIKVVQPKSGKEITHFKSGIFYDGIEMISFDGYSNFTATGSLENFQELESEIYLSWEKGRSTKMIDNRSNKFENIFSENSDDVEQISVKIFLDIVTSKFGNKSLSELLLQEKTLNEKENSFHN
ncbi:MAG: hypothetical protein IPN29_01720 [Saprospiraceae bacterium]|nr:hypothetical protein [Saprospiraceae bacterium]